MMELPVYAEGKISYNELWHMAPFERDKFAKMLNKYLNQKAGNNNMAEDL